MTELIGVDLIVLIFSNVNTFGNTYLMTTYFKFTILNSELLFEIVFYVITIFAFNNVK